MNTTYNRLNDPLHTGGMIFVERRVDGSLKVWSANNHVDLAEIVQNIFWNDDTGKLFNEELTKDYCVSFLKSIYDIIDVYTYGNFFDDKTSPIISYGSRAIRREILEYAAKLGWIDGICVS